MHDKVARFLQGRGLPNRSTVYGIPCFNWDQGGLLNKQQFRARGARHDDFDGGIRRRLRFVGLDSRLCSTLLDLRSLDIILAFYLDLLLEQMLPVHIWTDLEGDQKRPWQGHGKLGLP